MKPRRNEEAQAHIGLSSHRKKCIATYTNKCVTEIEILRKFTKAWFRGFRNGAALHMSVSSFDVDIAYFKDVREEMYVMGEK
jgi:hypothetical protein